MRVLVAVDSSEYSADAVRSVVSRPWPEDTKVRLIHAVPAYDILPPVGEFVGTGEQTPRLEESSREDAKALLRPLVDQIRQTGLDVESIVVAADPTSAILDHARTWAADLIVVGSHGRTGFTRLVLGSVAQSVVAHAPCSVEVVRRKASSGNDRRPEATAE